MYVRENRERSDSPRRAAFTLIELLAVISIIALLAGMIAGLAGFANRKTAEANAEVEMERIKNLLEEYRLDYGEYPLSGASDVDMRVSISNDLAQYYADLDLDPDEVDFVDEWDRSFRYQRGQGLHSKFQYRLWSLGSDTNDAADDITNWRGE